MKTKSILRIVIITLTLSSCGTLTKMRYSRGYKSNLEFSFKNRTEQVEAFQAKKAEKRQHESVRQIAIAGHNDSITTPALSITSIEKKIQDVADKKHPLNNKKIHDPVSKTKNTNWRSEMKEPMVKWGGWIFLFGSFAVFYTPIIILSIAGLILAIFGLRRIRRFPTEYTGTEEAIGIIAISVIAGILCLVNIDLAIAMAMVVAIVIITVVAMVLVVLLLLAMIRSNLGIEW